MKKLLALMVALTICLVSFGMVTAGAEGNVKITLQAREDPNGSDAQSRYFIDRINEFNAADNGIEVEMVFISTEAEYLSRLATDVASGSCANVFMEYGGSRVLDYLQAGLLLDLKPYYDEDPEWYNSIYESMWTPCVFDGYDGIYGCPHSSYQIVLMYNQKYLDQCGLEVPTTWEELMNCCAVLKENGIQPFLVGENDNYRFGHLFSNLTITSYGEEVAKKIGAREIGYDSDEAKAVYQLMIDAYNAGYFGDAVLSYGASEERAYIGAGESAFTWDLTNRLYWMDGSDEMNAGNLHITPFPAVNKDYYGWCQGGASQAFYVSTQNASEEEIAASVELLKFITSKEFIGGLMDATNSTYAIRGESSNTDRCYIYDEISELMGNTAGLVTELQNFDTEAAAITIVRNALSTIVQGASADEIAQEIVDEFEDLE